MTERKYSLAEIDKMPGDEVVSIDHAEKAYDDHLTYERIRYGF